MKQEMKNIKSYSDHNIQEAKDKILKAIKSCNNHRQIETIYSMIENFQKLYSSESSYCWKCDKILSEIYKSLNKKIEEINVN